jgi:ATP-dependent 26S proteasome regulatory subunit
VLLGYSIANISAILQQAANNAIAEGRTVIEKSDLKKSITTLEGNS